MNGASISLANEIVDLIIKDLYEPHRKRIELLSTFSKLNVGVVFVMDLTQCYGKYIQTNRLSEEVFRKTVTTDRNFVRTIIGVLIERGIRAIYPFLKRPRVYERLVEVSNNRYILIVGLPDAVIETDKGSIPVEIKFTSKSIDKPYGRTLIQAKLYGWLCNAPYTKLLIVSYVDGIKEFDVEAFTDDDVKKWLVKWTMRRPLWRGECEHCPFKGQCVIRTK